MALFITKLKTEDFPVFSHGFHTFKRNSNCRAHFHFHLVAVLFCVAMTFIQFKLVQLSPALFHIIATSLKQALSTRCEMCTGNIVTVIDA